MTDFLSKYGYAPDQEAMNRALEMIATGLEGMASEQEESTSKMQMTPASYANVKRFL